MRRTARRKGAMAAAGRLAALGALLLGGISGGAAAARGEAMLQFFNMGWNEIAERVPELAEAGYTSVWLPPSAKANGGYSVGYDLCDPFDLGSKDYRGWTTRYGSEADLLNLIELMHRFGIRVYLDNIMNHRSYDVPLYDEHTPADVYPGMVPEDFHLQTTGEGFYRKWRNTGNWQDEWEVLNLCTSTLLDIAHETPNANFGPEERTWGHPKPRIVRHPKNPELYDRMPHPSLGPGDVREGDALNFDKDNGRNLHVGFYGRLARQAITPELVEAHPGFFAKYGTNGVTEELIADYPEFYREDVGTYLCRNVRWVMDKTKADGLRLDAVKHVPAFFFGQQGGEDKDRSPAGYTGNAQWQFNMTRGFSDWDNHRDTVFDNGWNPRDDAMMFGEHLGEPPGYDGYFAAGMRLVDNPLRHPLKDAIENYWLQGFAEPGHGGFASNMGVMHSQSHDNEPLSMARRPMEHAFFMLRDGMGLFYTDGNNHAETLEDSGGAFPRWAQTAYLGQWGDNRMPNLCELQGNFGNGGWQEAVVDDHGDFSAWKRMDSRWGGGGHEDWVTMLVLCNAGWNYGKAFPGGDYYQSVSYPHEAGGNDAYLYQYAEVPGGANFYTWASKLHEHLVPENSYYVFAYKNPDPSDLWGGAGEGTSRVLCIREGGKPAGTVKVRRRDGKDGDPGFNPHGLTNAVSRAGDNYSYEIDIPVVREAEAVTFEARVDGSAKNVLLKLDGGMDLNGAAHEKGDMRDHPPALATDVELGYEQAAFAQRIWPEKFAAADRRHSQTGSRGATTYRRGAGGETGVEESGAENDFGTDRGEVGWVEHDPEGRTDGEPGEKAQLGTTATSLTVRVQTAKRWGVDVRMYYTTDGSYPEGAGGATWTRGTRVAAGTWTGTGADGESDWWRIDVPIGEAEGKELRYKIGAFRAQGGDNGWEVVWPGGPEAVAKKTKMMGTWTSGEQNLATKEFHPHNDYGETRTGLEEGFHLVSARAFLERDNGAPVYNTFRQTFYLDRETPRGDIAWPPNGEEIREPCEFVVRTDGSATKVLWHVEDGYEGNDGPGNGVSTNGRVEWAEATAVGPWSADMATNRALPKAWKFPFTPAPGGRDATVRVRFLEPTSADPGTWNADDPAGDRPEDLHVTERTRTVKANGASHYLRFDWPTQPGTMVEHGWEVRLKHNWEFVRDMTPEDAKGLFEVRLTGPSGAVRTLRGGELGYEWNYSTEHTLSFRMPNVYEGDPEGVYLMEATATREIGGKAVTIAATNRFRTKGPIAPACQITEPREFDSDGVKLVIVMEDTAEARTNAVLRQTAIRVQTEGAVTNVAIAFPSGGAVAEDAAFEGVEEGGGGKTWRWTWTVREPGEYLIEATAWADRAANTNLSLSTNSARRTATVEFRERVPTGDGSDGDWDDDGIGNDEETTAERVENGYDEYLSQAAAFAHHAHGKTDPAMPDTDGDGLPDGLELGCREGGGGTAGGTDTNGDGWPNFLPDLDPPFYNVKEWVGKVPGAVSGSGQYRLGTAKGSTTDPRKADTDGDGLPDGVEDADRNGWVDGDGAPMQPGTEPEWGRSWADGAMGSGETWEETSPCAWDSDGDGLGDGLGEDKDLDGETDMELLWEDGSRRAITRADYAAMGIGAGRWSEAEGTARWAGEGAKPWTSRAIDRTALYGKYATDGSCAGSGQEGGWPRLLILETDPLLADSDGDGLDDGWEARYGLDPLDNGTYNFRTGGAGDPAQGRDGDPDGDGFSNHEEATNGTNPMAKDTAEAPGEAGAIVVGRGAEIGRVNETTHYREFLDWDGGDLLALDDYDRGGDRSDIYRKFNDGKESSRDIVAFYFRDGGPLDGKAYFRVDFDDLQAGAEDGHLDVYVAINYGWYGRGEKNLPDQVNCKTAMGWNAVVAAYSGGAGAVYVDRNPGDNTTEADQSFEGKGVEKLEGAYLGAYYRADLDSVEWSVDRSALTGSGWNGLTENLLFQVYTTKDGTGDDRKGGGDKEWLNDFTDTIGDDWLCSDQGSDKEYVHNHAEYRYCIGKKTQGREDGGDAWVFNHAGRWANVALAVHGNQAIEAGSEMHALANTGAGAGYGRLAEIHGIYTNTPVNLHVTATLAAGLEWAESETEWQSGRRLNEAIREGAGRGTIRLLGTTYADHPLKYFGKRFNAGSEGLARKTLEAIYGAGSVSTNVLWLMERVADAETLRKAAELGFRATVLDQDTHLRGWFGAGWALGENGYKINRFWVENPGKDWPRMDAFAITSAGNENWFGNTDGGLSRELRRMLLRRAKDGWRQTATFFVRWEDLASKDNADAYDRNVRWLANHPWTRVRTLDDLLSDGETARAEEKDVTEAMGMQMQNWVAHACNGDYGNWYRGSERHEGLAGKVFETAPGRKMASALPWGTETNGVLAAAERAVGGITNRWVKELAESALYASVFETAFHQESNHDVSRWSYGTYIHPAEERGMGLEGFAWKAQSQTRAAAAYAAVDEWAEGRQEGTEAFLADVDLDGEEEAVLRNGRVMCLFETNGARMTGAWLKKGGRVWQMAGNFASQPESGWEREPGTDSAEGKLAARKVSGSSLRSVGGESFTGRDFEARAGEGRIEFAGDGVTNTVTLEGARVRMAVEAGGREIQMRTGLSPDLATLLTAGQGALEEESGEGWLRVTAKGTDSTVSARLEAVEGEIDWGATDTEGLETRTVPMRNLAQTRQVATKGTGRLTVEVAFEVLDNAPPTLRLEPAGPHTAAVGEEVAFRAEAEDPDGDGLELRADGMPPGAEFEAETGAFRWAVTNLSAGGRTNDARWEVRVAATDGHYATSATARVTVPWDAGGNGIADDWEWVHFGGAVEGEGDADGDGFGNYAEWVAGTDPNGKEEYVGWEKESVEGEEVRLEFRSVSGGTYHIEAADAEGLEGGTWTRVASGIQAEGTNTAWADTNAPGKAGERMYRILVPFHER